MNYIGVDLHKDSMSIIGVRKNGDIFVKERIPTKCIGKIEKFFSQDSIHPCVVICESIGFYHWFYDLISNKVEITRTRFHLVRRKTSIINSVRRIFLKNNLSGPKIINCSTLTSFLNKFSDKFTDHYRKLLYMFAENLFYFEKQISDIEKDIYKFLSMERFNKIHKIITTIPGVGDMVSATLISEIGDFKRFPLPVYLASYAGMVPKVFQSDKKNRHGKITKHGSVYIRYALINASWVAVRENRRIREIFVRIAKRAGRKKSIVAIGRKMLIWSWHLVVNNETWNSFNNYIPTN